MSIIEIKNFTKKYGNFTAINDLSLTINQGEIYGFVGKNGAGKSTTLRCILNMINPTSGSITVFGLDSKKDNKKIKSDTAYVPSESAFYNDMTCRDIFNYALNFTNGKDNQIEELSNYFELDLNKKISDLSLGNRKKVSLIQAFLKSPKLLILDEPTSGLDPLIQKKFFDLILSKKESGMTIFLSSHNLSEIEKYCDKVAIIKDGVLVNILDMKCQSYKQTQIVSYTTKDNIETTFEITQDINEVIKKLSTLDLKKLEIKNKSIEDEFLNFYS